MTDDTEIQPKPALPATLAGSGIGLLVGLLAIFATFTTLETGQGGLIAVRALFPFSMLLTLSENQIGWMALVIALVQFPLYGALIGHSLRDRSKLYVLIAAAMHTLAAFVCLSGMLPH